MSEDGMTVAVGRVTVRVPATVANLGAGFDVLAAAVGVHAEITVEASAAARVSAPNLDVPQDASNLIYRSAAAVARAAGHTGAFAVEVRSPIPLRSGLGSSAAAIVGGLVAANHLVGAGLDAEALLGLAAQIEGHPDNVGAALLGGVVIVVSDGARYRWLRLAPAMPLAVVLVTPALQIETAAARRVLPRAVSREDAVFNIGRASLLVAALAQGRPDLLGDALQDRLHQPYRASLVPGFERVKAAAITAGAYGAVLSGSGPTIAALAAPPAAPAVAGAMQGAFGDAGLTSRANLTAIEPQGALDAVRA
jgi:homoserine kinase